MEADKAVAVETARGAEVVADEKVERDAAVVDKDEAAEESEADVTTVAGDVDADFDVGESSSKFSSILPFAFMFVSFVVKTASDSSTCLEVADASSTAGCEASALRSSAARDKLNIFGRERERLSSPASGRWMRPFF